MNFKIVTDSSADMTALAAVPFASVPLTVNTAEREFVDNAELDTIAMLDYLKKYKGRSGSACPSPAAYLEAFGDAENVFCVTITSNLSGSCNSAVNAAKLYTAEHPDRRVQVIDSLSTGPENALIIEKLAELIGRGMSFDEICTEIAEYQKSTHLIFALESLHNLANNGRVNPLVAKISGVLGIRVIGKASAVGTLEITNKSRGAHGALRDIIANMKSTGYAGGRVKIHHANNPAAAEAIKARLLTDFPTATVTVGETRALCSFYAESGGVLVGFEA